LSKTLFPEPKYIEFQDSYLKLTKDVKLVLPQEADSLEFHAAEELATTIRSMGGNIVEITKTPRKDKTIFIGRSSGNQTQEDWEALSRHPLGSYNEGYLLDVSDTGIYLLGDDPAGTFYACRTLESLLELKDGYLMVPKVRIRDFPDYRYRGLYIEDKWGPDLMTLDDWKHLIDFMAKIKLNFLGVGVYGCWCIQYDNKITEFLMLPLKNYPDLATPKTISYYSPGRNGSVTLEYLSPMFTQDFFGEVIAYGKDHNVTVRPHFNSMGHNTLIPRHYPKVSSKDEDDLPTGYGFCLSSKKTYEMMFRIYDEIIDRYLLPNGIRSFHIGMDEVYPLIGIDPTEPKRLIDPWCKCKECITKTHEELLVDYLLQIMSHLLEKGIEQICLWNDQLVRHMDVLGDKFIRQLEERGLKDKVVLEWWWYGLEPPETFRTLRKELGLKRWVNPMTGYYFWMINESYLQNIQLMTKLGYENGAEGIESYGVYDPAFHRNYLALSEWSWNRETVDRIENFRMKYTLMFRDFSSPQVAEAIAEFDKIIDPGPIRNLISQLVYYPYTYVNKDKLYPRNYLNECLDLLLKDQKGSRQKLEEALIASNKAYEGFKTLKCSSGELSQVIRNYAAEAKRIESIAKEFLLLMDACEVYNQAMELTEKPGNPHEEVLSRLETCQTRLDEILNVHDSMMTEMEEVKEDYLIPHLMRDLTMMRNAFLKLHSRLAEIVDSIRESRGSLELVPIEWILTGKG